MNRLIYGAFAVALVALGIVMIKGHRRHLREPSNMDLYHQINLVFGWIYVAGGVVLAVIALFGD